MNRKKALMVLRVTMRKGGAYLPRDKEKPDTGKIVPLTIDELEKLFEEGFLRGPTGNPIVAKDGKSCVNQAMDYLENGHVLYFKSSDNKLISYSSKKLTTEEPLVYTPLEQPKAPGFFSKVWDKMLRLFSSSNPVCDDWNAYIAQTETNVAYENLMGQRRKPKFREENPTGQRTRDLNYDKAMKSFFSLPEHLLLTGDSKQLETAMLDSDLSTAEQSLLNFRKETAELIADLSEKPVKPVIPEPEKLENGVYLPSARQPAAQTTWNGCWSVSLQSLLQYHGVNLTQQEIRAHRLDCSIDSKRTAFMDIDLQKQQRAYYKKITNSDSKSAVEDYTDLIQSTLKDVVVHHAYIPGDADSNYLKAFVRKGLEEHKSPLSMCYRGHFRTIVGIDGDHLLMLDPKKDYPENEGVIKPTRVPLSSFKFKDVGASLDWIETMTPEKKEAAIEHLKKSDRELDHQEYFTRRKGYTTMSEDPNLPGGFQSIYPISYNEEATKRLGKEQKKAFAEAKENISQQVSLESPQRSSTVSKAPNLGIPKVDIPKPQEPKPAATTQKQEPTKKKSGMGLGR